MTAISSSSSSSSSCHRWQPPWSTLVIAPLVLLVASLGFDLRREDDGLLAGAAAAPPPPPPQQQQQQLFGACGHPPCQGGAAFPASAWPAYVPLWPTRSNATCTLVLRQASSFDGYIEHAGNCRGFVGTVILHETARRRRQLARILPSRNLTWAVAMPRVDVATVALYEDVLPWELVADAEWVMNEAIGYAPNVTVMNISCMAEATRGVRLEPNATTTAGSTSSSHRSRSQMATDHASSRDRDAALAMTMPSIWEGQELLLLPPSPPSQPPRDPSPLPTDRGLACYESVASRYDKVWLVGTSETRMLFDAVCGALAKAASGDQPSPLDKSVMYSQCDRLYFANMCQWGCGCSFFPTLFQVQPNVSNQLISVSCGLHGEYLKSPDHFEGAFQDLGDWARRLRPNGTRLQYRITNAVSPSNTRPAKLRIARNNVKYRVLRDLAWRSFGSSSSDVAVLDTFELTEPVFDLAADHVHHQPWVYEALAKVFLESLCQDEAFKQNQEKEQ